MSEDKRKNARTQGRYSGSDQEFNAKGQNKERPKVSRPAYKSKDEKMKSSPQSFGSKAPSDIDLQYEENSEYSFKELVAARKPRELRFTGEKVLSETENGISRIIYDPDFMTLGLADENMTLLSATTEWYEKKSVIKGAECLQPRLVCWYGPYPYSYAGATLEARDMPHGVNVIKQKVEKWLRDHDINVDLNSVLLNLYRTEKDSVEWHSDDELSLGVCPTIASVSLGATRKFLMRPKHYSLDKDDISYVNLTSGSLIVMDGCMQKDWQHKVPKEFHDKSPRINLTFRTIYPLNQLPPEMPRASKKKPAMSSDTKIAQQQEHNFVKESFPPLGFTDNYKKNKLWPKGNGNQPSAYSGKFQEEGDLNDETIQNAEEPTEIWDIPEINSSEPHPIHTDLNSNASFAYNESSNKNSCDSIDEYHSDSCEAHQSNNWDPTASEFKPIEMDAESSHSKKKSILNADAPDFIPQGTDLAPQHKFEKYSLYELAKNGSYVKGSENLHSFLDVIFNRILSESIFIQRDMYELEIYYNLHDGSLGDKHLKIIVDRICSMTLNAYKVKNRYRYPNRSNDEDNYRKPKTSYSRQRRY